ncbi:tlde1 domain-containing protein [Chondromyces apiculatus]|uniref:Tlde1 domain-containing protein n=1 Tax=Chondromyces apiculatus DSM 436 TaxID=1192034 RepID=A0A017T5Z7_9BACT|nr:tlde1 domain-containing protein [Chondromyces apiculatus]EYF04447.1 Hypothetical protein CAP_4415 [Chondromyces apiculatus DSM 436]
MGLGDPRNVFITHDMRRVMADPYAMAFARQTLFEARPLLRYAQLSNEGVVRELAATPAAAVASQVTLHFNGSFLVWREAQRGRIQRHSWSAVSGRPGYQDKSHQGLADQGPIPEGAWIVRQSEYQSAVDRSLWEKTKNAIGRGNWPGGARSWGLHRVWLHPKPGTETYGRSGFSIHGGSVPGSAGCIDLTDQMEAFVRLFLACGRDLDLTVAYP